MVESHQFPDFAIVFRRKTPDFPNKSTSRGPPTWTSPVPRRGQAMLWPRSGMPGRIGEEKVQKTRGLSKNGGSTCKSSNFNEANEDHQVLG